ncbi:hypothetical protein [Nocardia sp. alder85J]|uniref:hypothetical protein n=1 Tax=Nocardia sp. alder85J TaxID=2862949 RepID=UPI001CD43B7E|nr:hypothetical protein [Nocardia sp. alder85J]MCX4092426.1 hypothetical protein [Nocardia sp. alder85J]
MTARSDSGAARRWVTRRRAPPVQSATQLTSHPGRTPHLRGGPMKHHRRLAGDEA